MKMIGLAGPAGVGKDTIADYLVEKYNFTKFSFSDALYEEVAQAFGIDKAALYERSAKERETPALQYWYCQDKTFQNLMFHLLTEEGVPFPMDKWLSPRWVLQRWGTDYRRAQDPEYWINKAMLFTEAYLRNATEHPDTPRGGLVNCSVRFENERAFIQQFNGEIWHVRREGWGDSMGASEKGYVSEQGLPVGKDDKIIHNSGTIEQLGTASSLLMGAPAGTVIKVEPTVEEDKYVACARCGLVHLAYTYAQAVQEVAEYNDVMEASGIKDRITVDTYKGCNNCGDVAFFPVQASEVAGSLEDSHDRPVLYEDQS